VKTSAVFFPETRLAEMAGGAEMNRKNELFLLVEKFMSANS
jgi:hypothetical protein